MIIDSKLINKVKPMVIFDYKEQNHAYQWKVINDVVMGGSSSSRFYINDDGFGVFTGHVSIENNGGFSLLRYRFDKKRVENFKFLKLRILGNGNMFQFRIKSDSNDQHSYSLNFKTSKEWQEISLPLSDFKPIYRGRILNMPNYPVAQIEEIGILIGNKKDETFNLSIAKIQLV